MYLKFLLIIPSIV